MAKSLFSIDSGILIDTNIWLDYFHDTRPNSKSSSKAIDVAVRKQIPLFFSLKSVPDINYILVRELKESYRQQGFEIDKAASQTIDSFAQSQIESMSEYAVPVGLDAADMWLALKLRKIHNDLEDDFILAAASRCNADYLLTWDSALLSNTWVKAITPSELLELLALD